MSLQNPCNSAGRLRLSILILTVQSLLMLNASTTFAQEIASSSFATSGRVTADTMRELPGCKITDTGYGGPIIKFPHFNDKFAFTTGGIIAFTDKLFE